MGLDLYAKGYTGKFSCPYSTFYRLRRAIVRAVYGSEMERIYSIPYKIYNGEPTQEKIAIWNERCDDDIDILLLHSDCDGHMYPAQCRKVYRKLKNVEVEDDSFSIAYSNKELFARLLDILKYCADNRRMLLFE